MSLRTRLLVGLALLVVAAVGSSSWAIARIATYRVDRSTEERARELALPIVAALEESENIAASAERARRFVEHGVVAEVAIVDAQGHGVPKPIDDGRLLASRSGVPFVVTDPKGVSVYAPLHGLGAVRIRFPFGARVSADGSGNSNDGLDLLIVAIVIIDIGMIVLFGSLFLRRVIQPIEALDQAARRVAGGELALDPVPRHVADDELGRLIDSFNTMTRSLREQRDQVVAQAKLATVGYLAAGVGHEVGNPLAAIIGYAEMLLADARAAQPNNSATVDMLERMHKESLRIAGLIQELVDYSRPTPPRRERVDLGILLTATTQLLRTQPRLRGVEIRVSTIESLASALGDVQRLQQVIINLLVNAADAMNGAGAISVETGNAEGNVVWIAVSDEGPGVPEANRAAIFEPFFTTKPPGEGTGLGLAVSRSIVVALGGSLRLVDSARGARFEIRLPRWNNDSQSA